MKNSNSQPSVIPGVIIAGGIAILFYAWYSGYIDFSAAAQGFCDAIQGAADSFMQGLADIMREPLTPPDNPANP